jgi:predicted DNA-binding protein with PD1-like motif
MQNRLLFLFLLFLSYAMQAQDTGQPMDVVTISTEFQSVEIIRLGTGTDMLDGLNQAVRDKSIENGVILSGIGSVSEYHVHVVSDKKLPPAQEHPRASVAMDLTSVQGYVFNGRVHAHITLADENSVIGGHLEKGTTALTFIIVTVGILPDSLKLEHLDTYQFTDRLP